MVRWCFRFFSLVSELAGGGALDVDGADAAFCALGGLSKEAGTSTLAIYLTVSFTNF